MKAAIVAFVGYLIYMFATGNGFELIDLFWSFVSKMLGA